MNMVGAAATMLKGRLDMIYDVQSTEDGRVFSGLHDTLLPMSSKTRSIFQQLRGSKSKKNKKSKADDANAGKISGQVLGTVDLVEKPFLEVSNHSNITPEGVDLDILREETV